MNAADADENPAGLPTGQPPASASSPQATQEYIARLERALAGERAKSEGLQRELQASRQEAHKLAAKFALNPRASGQVENLQRENASLRRRLEGVPKPQKGAGGGGRNRADDRLVAMLRDTYPQFWSGV